MRCYLYKNTNTNEEIIVPCNEIEEIYRDTNGYYINNTLEEQTIKHILQGNVLRLISDYNLTHQDKILKCHDITLPTDSWVFTPTQYSKLNSLPIVKTHTYQSNGTLHVMPLDNGTWKLEAEYDDTLCKSLDITSNEMKSNGIEKIIVKLNDTQYIIETYYEHVGKIKGKFLSNLSELLDYVAKMDMWDYLSYIHQLE